MPADSDTKVSGLCLRKLIAHELLLCRQVTVGARPRLLWTEQNKPAVLCLPNSGEQTSTDVHLQMNKPQSPKLGTSSKNIVFNHNLINLHHYI